ncbi:hypothetical protein [Solitalea koreensis]|uniref:Uncharacterized protein n=1 Tax=Solitalea koreensis TaxID=543615 RepID=A0A521DR99_9SPHI|nr:hypothetical protein [Solitalea koreensis]SMO73450.1 hypothetical protein SAMN06265350_10819 [Solitalea koreensis]
MIVNTVSLKAFAQQNKAVQPVVKAKPATTTVKPVAKTSKATVSKSSGLLDSITASKYSKTGLPQKKSSDSLSKTDSDLKKSSKATTPTGAKAAASDSLVARTEGGGPTTVKSAQSVTGKSVSAKKGTGKIDPKFVTKKDEKPKATPKLPTNIITKNAVGVLKLGTDIDTIKKLYPKERVYRVYIYDQNTKYLQYQVMASDKVTPFLNITQDCVTDSVCLIKQIMVKHPYFKTDRDIKVGNTLDDLFLAYGYLGSRWEEENLIVSNEEGLDFIMDTSQIPKRWYKKMNLDRLPLPTKIIGIQISIVE